jgi:hypothetical protein
MEPSTSPAPGLGVTVRWLARAVSVIVLLVGGFFVATEILSGGPHDWAQLVLMIIWLGALPAAWFWDLGAGVVVVAALALHAVVNPSILGSAFVLVLVDGILFVLSGLLNRRVPRPD